MAPSEQDLRYRLMSSVNTLLSFAAHHSTCPEANAENDHGTDEACPCGFRVARKEARRVASEMQVIFDREDSEQWSAE